MKTSEEIQAAQQEKQLRQCYETLHLIYNGAIPNDIAYEFLTRSPRIILARVLLDVCNRVDGAFRYINTFVDDMED